ncbi:MAG: agmatinase [Phycisphaerae bacterium]|nr:agmatinase [Phycisphaerae bacterium]
MTQPTSIGFLDLPAARSNQTAARYAVLPVPYEGTVSYEPGTAAGPAAIIRASQQVELFDEEFSGDFSEAGIVTCDAIEPADDPAEQMERVKLAAREILGSNEFLLAIGGEHSITAPLVEAVSEVHGPVSVLQIDAHADLRDSYGGTKLSHACVMRRVLETTDSICQVGVRSYSQEEYRSCREQIDNLITPEIIRNEPDWIDRALALLGDMVYVTIDMDGLDPSIAPGVGTPEPDGLTWRETTELLRKVCYERQVVAADIVEVKPIPPNHVTEFIAARLAYKIIAYTQQ